MFVILKVNSNDITFFSIKQCLFHCHKITNYGCLATTVKAPVKSVTVKPFLAYHSSVFQFNIKLLLHIEAVSLLCSHRVL